MLLLLLLFFVLFWLAKAEKYRANKGNERLHRKGCPKFRCWNYLYIPAKTAVKVRYPSRPMNESKFKKIAMARISTAMKWNTCV